MNATVTITCKPEDYVRIRLSLEHSAATYKQLAGKPENVEQSAELYNEYEIHQRMLSEIGRLKT